jgi:hypothetical protein
MKNTLFFSLALLNGAFLVAGGDVPTIKQAVKLQKIEVRNEPILAPSDSYSSYAEEDSSYNHRPYSPNNPIKDMATAPADSYSNYADEDSIHSTTLSKNIAAQIVAHKIEPKNNPLQRSASTKKITTLPSSGEPITAPADSYSDYQDNSLSNTFENLASALSDSYGAYIPDEKVTAPVDSYSGYQYQSIDAI